MVSFAPTLWAQRHWNEIPTAPQLSESVEEDDVEKCRRILNSRLIAIRHLSRFRVEGRPGLQISDEDMLFVNQVRARLTLSILEILASPEGLRHFERVIHDLGHSLGFSWISSTFVYIQLNHLHFDAAVVELAAEYNDWVGELAAIDNHPESRPEFPDYDCVAACLQFDLSQVEKRARGIVGIAQAEAQWRGEYLPETYFDLPRPPPLEPPPLPLEVAQRQRIVNERLAMLRPLSLARLEGEELDIGGEALGRIHRIRGYLTIDILFGIIHRHGRPHFEWAMISLIETMGYRWLLMAIDHILSRQHHEDAPETLVKFARDYRAEIARLARQYPGAITPPPISRFP